MVTLPTGDYWQMFVNAKNSGASIDTLKELFTKLSQDQKAQAEKEYPGIQEEFAGGRKSRKGRKSRRGGKKTKKAGRKGKKSYSRRR